VLTLVSRNSTTISASPGTTLAAPGRSANVPMFQTVSGPAMRGNSMSIRMASWNSTFAASLRMAMGVVPA
jgi:hypothetical protein